ncbi:MAG: ATP-binding cassette domain-containing protein [Anaerolineaceae bacterium]|nr:ATP-binding cassette domain-containing protein [Anaerolineaceae bacterium]
MTGELIRLDDLSFSYGNGRPVLSGVGLQVRRGDRLALLGPTGSGKTTLLHLMVGLLHPTGGRIEIFGRRRQEEADFVDVRTRVGLLFQDAEDQLFCPTVAEDVAFGPLNLGKSREQAMAIVGRTLASLGLAGYQERITYRLSGGEKRLVSLAAVLAMEPEVLLLDEPATGLDERMVERLVAILNRLSQTMVIISHDRKFLDRVTDQALRLCEGRLEPCDPALARSS